MKFLNFIECAIFVCMIFHVNVVISSVNICSFIPIKTESFESVSVGSIMTQPYSNGPIFSGFATISTVEGSVNKGDNSFTLANSYFLIKSHPVEGHQYYGSKGDFATTTITFNQPVDSFGGHFGYFEDSDDMAFLFYDSSNTQIGDMYFHYDPIPVDGYMHPIQYCSDIPVKYIEIVAKNHVFDLLGVTYRVPAATTNQITSNQLTTSQITSGSAPPVDTCTFTPMITESFENIGSSYFSDIYIFSGFATLTTGDGYVGNDWGLGSGVLAYPADGQLFYASDGDPSTTVIIFSTPVDKFGGYFGYHRDSPDMEISFYDSSNSLIHKLFINYDAAASGGNLRKVQYCSNTAAIKKIIIVGDYHVMDMLGVTYSGITSNQLTSAEITSSEITTGASEITSAALSTQEVSSSHLTTESITSNSITTSTEFTSSASEISSSQVQISSSEITSSKITSNNALTTGNSDPIYECTVAPTLTEGFESFYVENGYNTAKTMATILSGFAAISNRFGLIIRGDEAWVLEPSIYTQPADGSQFYASDGSNEITTITFNTPIDSFGGYFAISAHSSTVQIKFYDDDYTVIDTETFTYSNGGSGVMKHVQYCASGQKIKYVQIYGPNHAIDLVSVSFTGDFTTQSEITSNELTSSKITSNSITSNSITSNSITSNSITSSSITSNSITSNSEVSSNSITSSEISTNQITSMEVSTSKINNIDITSNQDHVTTSKITITTSQNQNVVMTTGGSKLVSLITVTFTSGLFTLNQNNFTATMLLLAGINYNQDNLDRFVYTSNTDDDGAITVSFFIEEPRNVNDISSEELTQLIVEKLTEKLDSGEPINGMTLTSVNNDKATIGEEDEEESEPYETKNNKKTNVGVKVAIGVVVGLAGIGIIIFILARRRYHHKKTKKQSQNIEMNNI